MHSLTHSLTHSLIAFNSFVDCVLNASPKGGRTALLGACQHNVIPFVLELELRERASFPPKKMRQIAAD